MRVLSLLFAAALQVLPMARVVYSAARAVAPESAVLFRFIIGTVAAMGACDAVSGASTVILSPSTATGMVGQAFSYRIIVGPRAATIYRADPLPPGLYLDRSYILGTPTAPGQTPVKLTVSDGGHAVSKWIIIYVLGLASNAPPVFAEPPAPQSAVAGDTTIFHSSVISEAPASFQWYFNGQPVSGATTSDFTFVNTPGVFTGLYSVVAVNEFGSATSAPVRLFLRVPLVDSTAAWAYTDSGKTPPAAWRKLTFKDAAWPIGAVPFGYGWGGENTLISTGPNALRPNVTTWFRHKFHVADSNAYSGFSLELQADDGAVVYLNGKELLRQNMKPKGPISPRLPALTARDFPADHQWWTTNIFKPLVLTGTNIVAVEVHQAKTNGADMRFDCRFSGLSMSE